MKLIRAIIRPDKAKDVLAKLREAGFPAVITTDVSGRGRNLGVKIGDRYYNEVLKTLLLMVVKDEEKDKVVNIISDQAKSKSGSGFGSGKIFISQVVEVHTIDSGESLRFLSTQKKYG
ncbi:P-II family nitrogen regulator [Fuchsiella alkaliacetigena]|uniref:P-II family nitrogen regulator n=1 Tax=Fuchsiella alkaliacetigena TaxID=957042 RepID=UPI00200B43AE|nr:P-II family nitrogen regulator [Fuchsiella alkaliacetigena]MCK8824668.1 P-II family nitrogen regulator [Fuchsiella alkaliacetigena]